MYLHDDREKFKRLVADCYERTNTDAAMIEKDYFVTLFLKHLLEAEPNIVFKGGTCLSKCYKLIDRFSEDIDISMMPSATKKQRKGLKYHVIGTAEKLGLKHMNADTVDSGKSYADHRIAFPSRFTNKALKPELIVETVFRKTPLPTLTLPTSSILYDHLKKEGAEAIINEFGLEPFNIAVPSLQLTFVDKLYSLNSYYLKEKVDARSRHLYDLHRMLPKIEFNGEFFMLLIEIGKHERSEFAKSEKLAGFDPSKLTASLREIISNDVYREDYEKRTLPLLFDPVPYDETIRSLRSVLDRIDIDEGEFLIDKPLNFVIRRGRRTARV